MPAPKFSTAEDEVDVEEGEAGVEEARATGRADEVLEDVSLVVAEGFVAVDDERVEAEEAEASDADERTLGQKVLLQVCMSVGEHC